MKKRSSEGEGGSAKTLCMPFEQPDLPEGAFQGRVTSYIIFVGGGFCVLRKACQYSPLYRGLFSFFYCDTWMLGLWRLVEVL